jgi:CBS domain-containing protein
VWVVEGSGRVLDELRQDLLARAAAEEPQGEAPEPTEGAGAGLAPGTDGQASAQERYRFLTKARQRAEKGEPVEMSVRDLLEHWGASRRGSVVSQAIDADLANHGLTAVPNYRMIGLDGPLSLRMQALPDDEPALPDEQQQPPVPDGEQELTRELRRTVGTLRSASGGVAAVSRDASITEALTTMLLDDYSQLAVLSGPRQLVGAVTWKSIAEARNVTAEATLRDALVGAEPVSYDRDLREILPELQETGYVFVKGATNTIDGIVTTTDVVGLYGEVEEPFLLLGELDLALRAVVVATFTPREINALCNPDGDADAAVDKLSFGDYQRVLENPGCWGQIGWALDRGVFMRRLEEIREFRNDFMHYNPDPDRAVIPKLREMIKVVRRYSA